MNEPNKIEKAKRTISEKEVFEINVLLSKIPILEYAVEVGLQALRDTLPILEQRSFVPKGGVTACTVGPEVQGAIAILEAALQQNGRMLEARAKKGPTEAGPVESKDVT